MDVVRLGCLFHDIGKVVEGEGSHVKLGVELLKKFNIPEKSSIVLRNIMKTNHFIVGISHCAYCRCYLVPDRERGMKIMKGMLKHSKK
jgi:HD superfamily phosphodiesterase